MNIQRTSTYDVDPWATKLKQFTLINVTCFDSKCIVCLGTDYQLKNNIHTVVNMTLHGVNKTVTL